MITREQLLEAGYKQYQVYHKEFTKIGYQKLFEDERSKKYYITLYEYDNRRWKSAERQMPDFSYAPDSQFQSNGTTFNVQTLCDASKTVQDVQEFYERLWVSIGCDYYKEWEEV